MPYLPSLPQNSTMAELARGFPHVFRHALPLAQAVMRDDSPLTAQQREFLFAYCSGLNQCHYCHSAHTAVTEALGGDGAAVRAAVQSAEDAPVDDAFRALLVYLRKLTLQPHTLTQADADAVYAAGWDERALHDAVAVGCMANFFNRYLLGTGVDAPDEDLARRGKMLAEHGYVITRVTTRP